VCTRFDVARATLPSRHRPASAPMIGTAKTVKTDMREVLAVLAVASPCANIFHDSTLGLTLNRVAGRPPVVLGPVVVALNQS